MESRTIIEMRTVGFTYAGAEQAALENVTLSVKAGEFLLIAGKSGCGKTTVTRLINGLIPQFHEGELTGEVLLDGNDITAMPLHEISDYVGSVFQDPRSQFFTSNTTAEMAFSCENLGLERNEIQSRIAESVQALSLENLMDRDMFTLSSGERQSVAIASVFAPFPPVFVLDEPSANLDTAATEKLRKMLVTLKERGCTVIISEHRLHYLFDLVDTVVVMEEGAIRQRYEGEAFRRLSNDDVHALGLRCLFPEKLAVQAAQPVQEGPVTLSFERLTFSYPGYEAVFENVSSQVRRGEIVGVCGHNGAGKTSLMEVLCGIANEQSGIISLDGERAGSKERIEKTYYVMQDADYQLFCESVEKELLLGKENDPSLSEKAATLLAALDLSELKDRHPGSLSGGQKQRVSIALAGMKDAEVLCFDEPTSGLDAVNMRKCAALLKDLSAQGKTILVVSHDIEFLAATCGRILWMEGGAIVDDFVLCSETFSRLSRKEKTASEGQVAMRKKKPGIGHLMELAGEKKALMVASGIVSTVSVFFQMVPLVAVYFIMAELLRSTDNATVLDSTLLIQWAVVGLCGMVLGYVFMYAGGMCSHIAAFRILCGVRARVVEHLGRLPLGYFDKNASGKIKTVIEHDTERIEDFIAHQIPDMISSAVMLVVMAIAMFYLDPLLAVAALVPVILGYVAQFSMMMGKKAQASMVEYFDAQESIHASCVQYVKGMPSIKVFGQTVHSFRRFYVDMVRYRDFCLEYTDHFQFGFTTFRVLLLSISTFVLPVGLFLFSGQADTIAFAITFLFYLILAPGIAAPVMKLNNLASSMRMIMEGASRVDKILAEKPLPEEPGGRGPHGYDVVFHAVDFSYTARSKVLHHIDFAARQGEITALVGPSGSGKSTIAQLIPRFWDVDEGSVSIGGVDIRAMGFPELMDTMSFVFQESFLLSETIYRNILIGRPDASREEVESAARAARCHDFIMALPEGYETVVGDGGVYLSGGEEQRVSVARAILKDAPILVLDEATAYADPENEYEMQQALSSLIRGKTVIVIAHRLATIQNAHQILVLKQGEIVERGTHHELLEQAGLYRALWDAHAAADAWEIDRSVAGDG